MLGPAAGAGRWTAADLDGLPENGLRYEVLNGQLVVSPVPEPRHQVLIQRLLRVLDDAAPTTFVALGGVGILIGDDEPIPDVIVATEPIPWDARGIPVEQVQLPSRWSPPPRLCKTAWSNLCSTRPRASPTTGDSRSTPSRDGCQGRNCRSSSPTSSAAITPTSKRIGCRQGRRSPCGARSTSRSTRPPSCLEGGG